MVILKEGQDVSGQVVSLGDPLTMTISLDTEYTRTYPYYIFIKDSWYIKVWSKSQSKRSIGFPAYTYL